MADQTELQQIFSEQGFSDFRWVDPTEIVVGQWVRMKCMYGCDSYGRNASCPPNTPSIGDCRTFFAEYRLGAIFHFNRRFDDPDESHDWTRRVNRTLVDLEQAVVQAGNHKAFLMFLDHCNLCRECANARSNCRNKRMARPSPEGMGVDVAATVAKYGYAPEQPDRFAFLLIE